MALSPVNHILTAGPQSLQLLLADCRFSTTADSYSAIDIHPIALVVVEEHIHVSPRVLVVETHTLSAIGQPCA